MTILLVNHHSGITKVLDLLLIREVYNLFGIWNTFVISAILSWSKEYLQFVRDLSLDPNLRILTFYLSRDEVLLI